MQIARVQRVQGAWGQFFWGQFVEIVKYFNFRLSFIIIPQVISVYVKNNVPIAYDEFSIEDIFTGGGWLSSNGTLTYYGAYVENGTNFSMKNSSITLLDKTGFFLKVLNKRINRRSLPIE